MFERKYLVVGLLALLVTAGVAGASYFLSSNHLTGTSTAKATLTLTGNTTAPTYLGDTFHLVAHVSDGLSGLSVTFYDNGVAIGTVATDGSGDAILDYIQNNAVWDIWAEANHP